MDVHSFNSFYLNDLHMTMAVPPSDRRLKFVQDRIGKVEHQFGDICRATAAYVRTLAKLRDKGDDVTRALLAYAQSETLNLTTKTALTDFVENFSAVEDFRNIQIQRLDAKVIEPMLQYGTSCRKAKERIKEAFAAHAKELKQKPASDKGASKNAKDQTQTTQQGMTDALRANRELEEEIDSFERKKLHDIKMLMSDFVNVELSFHSKALEMFTLCYRSMTTIREDHDLQQYRESLRPLVRHSNQSDQFPNASNSSSAGGMLLPTQNSIDAIEGKQRRRQESNQNNHSPIEEETTTPSPSSSSLYTSLSQNEESDGFTEDGAENASGEEETDQTSDEEKLQRKWLGK